MKLLLTERTAYPFTVDGGIYFCGYFIFEGKKYSGHDAISFFAQELEHATFPELLAKIDGLFSVIIQTDKNIMAAVDRVLAFRLFYAVENGELIIADSAGSVYDALETATIDKVSLEEFKTTHVFISGNNTLYEQIKQLQAGEWLTFYSDSAALDTGFYFVHGDGINYDLTPEQFLEGFSGAFDKACDNLRLALEGRTAAVALSGGYDSRELLAMLAKIGHKNVVCFTFGIKGTRDYSFAKKAAEFYGHSDNWIFIEYTKSTWKKLRKDADFLNYLKTKGNMSAVPEIQDYAAIKYLTDNKLLPKDSVILTGNTGDIVGGHLEPGFFMPTPVDYEKLIELLVERYYDGLKLSPALRSRLESYFDKSRCANNAQSEAQYHCFSMKERQTKFCISSQRMFEFFGYESLLPVCDLNLMEYMKRVPLDLKKGKTLLHNYLSSYDTVGYARTVTTVYSSVSDMIRKTTLLRKLIRKASKLTKYFRSINRIERIYPFGKYAIHALRGSEKFTINYILAYDMIKQLREKRPC